jgi:hypothetical protein
MSSGPEQSPVVLGQVVVTGQAALDVTATVKQPARTITTRARRP